MIMEYPGDGRLMCRVCLSEQETKEEPHELISPCNCTGTQRHVHLKCLRKWQENVQSRDAKDERAYRCNVCRSLFTVPPPKPRAAARLCQALQGVGGAICITLLAFGLSAPPWPHVALLVLLLLGSRSSSLLGLGLVLLASLLAALHARGLRVVLRLDGTGRLGLAMIRHGAPLQGVGPGTLLVASEDLEGTLFRRSVVLLYEHGRAGAKGVMLTQGLPMGGGPQPRLGPAGQENSTSGSAGASAGARAGEAGEGAGQGGAGEPGGGDGSSRRQKEVVIRHFLGGPVGMPGEGVREEVVLLHNVGGVPGATRVPLHAAAAAPPAPAAGAAHAAADHSMDEEAWDAAQIAAAVLAGRSGVLAGCREGWANAAGGAAAAAAPEGTQGGLGAGAAGAGGSDAAGPGAAALFAGGSLADVLERAAAAKAATLSARGAEDTGGGWLVHVYHGVCSWVGGQLEGEIRSGAWALAPATLLDVLQEAPGAQAQAWGALWASNRLVRPLA